MIRRPEFVTKDVFAWARAELQKKKPRLDMAKARLESLTEGLCAQMMHIGPYENEPASIAQMEQFILEQGYSSAISDPSPSGRIRRHHERRHLSPRRSARIHPESLLFYR